MRQEYYGQLIGPYEIVHNTTSWAHTYIYTLCYNGPTRALPMHTPTLHMGFYECIVNHLRHYVSCHVVLLLLSYLVLLCRRTIVVFVFVFIVVVILLLSMAGPGGGGGW